MTDENREEFIVERDLAGGEFGFHVDSYEIRPPMAGGRIKFGAKVTRIVRYTADGSEDVPDPVYGEHYGETRAEAEGKAAIAMRSWIEARGGKVIRG